MSTARARWSDAEKKAVLDCYNLAADADDFFKLLELALGASYFRRTIKAYLTFLNDNLLPKTDPRRPVYQSLCEANQKEIAANKAAEEAAKLAAATPVPPVPATVTPASPSPVTGAVGVTTTPVVLPEGDWVEKYDWVEKEVDVVPRVPPGRATPPSLFKDPRASSAQENRLPTLSEALAAQATAQATEHAASRKTVGEFLATEEGRKILAASMAHPVRGTPASVSAGAVFKPTVTPVVTPDPAALVPRYYPQLPSKATISAVEVARVLSISPTEVEYAIAYGIIPSWDSSHVTLHTAQRIHDAMSEGHSFSGACGQVNPASVGTLPMETLIKGVDAIKAAQPGTTVEDQSPTVVPNTEAGKVTLKADDWTVSGGPMNPKSVSEMAARSGSPIEVLAGPPSLFQQGEVFPVSPMLYPVPQATELRGALSVEVSSEPAKTVEAPGEVTPGGEFFQYAESIRIKLTGPDSAPNGNGDVFLTPAREEHPNLVAHPPVKGPGEPAKTTDAGFEQYTLEAVRDGIVGVAQGVDILGHKDTRRAEWALSLLASGKITVDQCDRLLFAKSV